MKQIDLFDKIPDEKSKKRKGRDPFEDRTERKKKKKKLEFYPPVNVKRIEAKSNEGLTTEQVNERLQAGLYNKAPKKYSKTYKSIFIGNICTIVACGVTIVSGVPPPSFRCTTTVTSPVTYRCFASEGILSAYTILNAID